jgi:hypothetical protein
MYGTRVRVTHSSNRRQINFLAGETSHAWDLMTNTVHTSLLSMVHSKRFLACRSRFFVFLFRFRFDIFLFQSPNWKVLHVLCLHFHAFI